VVAALQRLTAPDGALDDRFGDEVALDGDTAAVGAPNDDVGGLQNRGSVYIFSRIGSMWTFQTTIAPADPKANERFGQSVALQGITLVVGTAESTGNVSGHGSAYVFVGSGPAWVQQRKLTSIGLTTFGGFGAAVAIDGSTIVVGAPRESGRSNGTQGAAHVFVRNGTTWTLQQRLFADDGVDQDGFGNAVAIRSDRAVIGAQFSTVGGATSRGSVDIFQRSTLNFTWSLEQKVVANDGAADDSFGFDVSMDATRILVGAPGAKVNGIFRGAAYILSRSGLRSGAGGPSNEILVLVNRAVRRISRIHS
jgi:hypothetical protein